MLKLSWFNYHIKHHHNNAIGWGKLKCILIGELKITIIISDNNNNKKTLIYPAASNKATAWMGIKRIGQGQAQTRNSLSLFETLEKI